MAKNTIVKKRLAIELNDGHGSYICEHGYVHDYSRKNLDAIELDESGPFETFEEYKRWLAEDTGTHSDILE